MLRNREGFTLIELLIVVVIIGILAAIALPKFGETRERAYLSAMQSDLRNLQTEMEMYYADNTANPYSYTGATIAGAEVQPSQGVNLTDPTISNTGQGWSAVATHDALDANVECAVFVGDAAAVDPATEPGVVTCDAP